MADDADRAAEQMQRDIDAAVKRRRVEGPEGTGFCLACGAVVEDRKRWCDAECRDDWVRVSAGRRRG